MRSIDLPSYAYMMRHYDGLPKLIGKWCISINVGTLNSIHIGVINDYGNWTEVPFE